LEYRLKIWRGEGGKRRLMQRKRKVKWENIEERGKIKAKRMHQEQILAFKERRKNCIIKEERGGEFCLTVDQNILYTLQSNNRKIIFAEKATCRLQSKQYENSHVGRQ
jgi:hypothetical protein